MAGVERPRRWSGRSDRTRKRPATPISSDPKKGKARQRKTTKQNAKVTPDETSRRVNAHSRRENLEAPRHRWQQSVSCKAKLIQEEDAHKERRGACKLDGLFARSTAAAAQVTHCRRYKRNDWVNIPVLQRAQSPAFNQ